VGNSDESATPRELPAATGDRAAREAEFTRRALLEAGWTAPVVLAITLPARAYAQSAHADHGDGPHADHGDHSDQTGPGGIPPVPGAVHTDHFDHGDHADHGDAHLDAHTDVGHGDLWTAPGFLDGHDDLSLDCDHVDAAHVDHCDV
jgi:hypothetical protein